MTDSGKWLDGWPARPPGSHPPPAPGTGPPPGPGQEPGTGQPPGTGEPPPGGSPRRGWLRGRGCWYRALAGAAAGGGVALVLLLIVIAGARSGLASRLPCSHQQPWGCLGLAIVGVAAMEVAMLLLPWPLLYAAGVRPAWQPVLLAVLGRIVLYVLYGLLFVPVRGAVWFVALPALSYGAAALATASDAARRWRLLAAAIVLAGCPLLTGWLVGFGAGYGSILGRLFG